MKKSIKVNDVQLERLSEEDRRALRGSRFARLPPHLPNEAKIKTRVPHPGGPVATNKAVALAKFLQRKLETPSGTASLDPALVEAAVENAKAAVQGVSSSSLKIRHVETFSDDERESDDKYLNQANVLIVRKQKPKQTKKKKKKKKVEVTCE